MRRVENGFIEKYNLFLDSDHNMDLTLNLKLKIGKSCACCYSINLKELSEKTNEPIKMLFNILDITDIEDLVGLPVVIVNEDGLIRGIGNYLYATNGPIEHNEDFFIPKDLF